MNEKLSYEEWRKRYTAAVSEETVSELQKYHSIDAHKEIEAALRREYDIYLKGEFH